MSFRSTIFIGRWAHDACRASDLTSSSQRLKKDPITGEEVPSQFAISCTRCGAKSAVDTWPQDKILLAIIAVLALLLVLMILVVRARGATSLVVIACVVAYVCAAVIPLKHRGGDHFEKDEGYA